ncbi:IclR family transcriptional regulator [Dactylosporangium siamense]|uniref:IclR family transcriptional regulator n=1 Tax=Dactylosporangium siamense TaxID=685454 RepID=A0A919PRD2_9ACTN|nr:IclR family transcriptional regulator [Dactylosporangium siamense]GIG47090.1 IclR family transcriptional regulator [Dactylosporangium siamense]
MATHASSTDGAAPSVLWKAFDVLAAFNQGHRILTLSDIARRSGLPKSTVHRLLGMLLDVGAVERVGTGYKIGLRMFTMGALSLDVRLRETALPYLERLRRVTGQTVHLAMLHGADVIYLEKLTSPQSPNTPALIGGRLPAGRTGVGKAMLAFGDRLSTELATEHLQEVRRRGVATDREEAAPGLACVAVPVLNNGRAVAAVSVAFAAANGSGDLFVNPLRETVTGLSRVMATSPDLAA